MDPWGTSASMLVQEEACPFKTIRCFQKLKKSVIVFKILPDAPFWFNLNISPLCQTLLNALDIYKNTALTSGLSSKGW